MAELFEEVEKKIAEIELTERQREFAIWNMLTLADNWGRHGDYLDGKLGISCQRGNNNTIRCNRIFDDPLSLLVLKMAIVSCEEGGMNFDYSQAVITCQMYPKEKRNLQLWLVKKFDFYVECLIDEFNEDLDELNRISPNEGE